jgi:hypothetical protein
MFVLVGAFDRAVEGDGCWPRGTFRGAQQPSQPRPGLSVANTYRDPRAPASRMNPVALERLPSLARRPPGRVRVAGCVLVAVFSARRPMTRCGTSPKRQRRPMTTGGFLR